MTIIVVTYTIYTSIIGSIMNRDLTIFLFLSCTLVSMHALQAEDLLIEQTQVETNNNFDCSKIKEGYSNNMQYALYAAVGSYLGHVCCSQSLPQDVKFLFLTITSLSSIWGVSNMAKWLFLHLNPQCTNKDVTFLERSERLMAMLLLLNVKEKHNLYELLHILRIPKKYRR